MKTLPSLSAAFLLAASIVNAQVPGIPGLAPAPAASAGTTLGANTTSGASGIDLANRLKLSGYVDFMYANLQNERNDVGNDAAQFKSAVDLDFLLDFSPVTAEVHTRINDDSSNDLLEQAFIRYNFNRDVSLTFGRQLSLLGYEADEDPYLNQVSNAYLITDGISAEDGELRTGSNIRRTYNDGVRANFNNGRLGFSIGLHNKLSDTNGTNDNTKSGNIAVDLQAAFMILPGLEGRLGYAHESVHKDSAVALNKHYTAFKRQDEIERFNAWLGYNQGPLTLALEYDDWNIVGVDAWNVMLLGRYQVNPLFALTVRYSHEDLEQLTTGGNDVDVNRLTLYAAFALADNLRLGLEYTHSGVEEAGGSDYDVDEFYAETVLSF